MANDVTTIEKPKTLAEAKRAGEDVQMMTVGGSFLPAFASMGEVMNFAALMAGGGPMVGKPFQGNPGACLGIIMQAGRVNMDPFALSQKAYLVNEVISYESQAVMAMIYGSGVIDGRMKFEFDGEGQNRVCIASAKIKGEPEPSVKRSPPIGQIHPKNSPLWKSDPDQQQSYYTARTWARLYAPDILMGVYTRDEMVSAEMVNVTPKDDPAARLTASITGKAAEPADEPDAPSEPAQADTEPEPADEPDSDPDAAQQAPAPSTDGPNPDDEWHNLDEIEAAFSEDHSELELGATLDAALALSWVTDAQAKEINDLAKVRQGEIA